MAGAALAPSARPPEAFTEITCGTDALAPLDELIKKSTETEDATMPPGRGLSTDTLAKPASFRSVVVRSVVSAVEVTDVGCRNVPFHRMIDPATKFMPFTVSVNGPLVPAFALDGFNEMFVGAPF